MKRNLKSVVSTGLVLLGLTAVVPLGAWAQMGKHSARSNRTLAQYGNPNISYVNSEVLHQLKMLPYYSIFDNLSFRLEGSKVILTGQVVNPWMKSDAENVVKHVHGVQQVDNQIEVLPVSNFDDRIRRAEARAIYGHPGMEPYAMQSNPPIHIIVKNGNVLLTGVVANEMDRTLAGIRANGVSGVFSVTNNLIVENKQPA